jgi:hypothetical protein
VSASARGALKSRAKGKRGEREIVRLARQYGLETQRTWHTAQSGDPVARRCDVLVAGHQCQVKLARRGLEQIYRALDGVAFAFLRQDHRAWVAVLPAEELLAMLRKLIERAEGQCA